jgi:trans-aconitate methyltransferase
MGRPAAGQDWNADDYARHAGFVPALGEDVLAMLAPARAERVLDLGCGDGVLTRRIRESGAEVVGLEPDPALAARARENGLTVLQQDAHAAFGSRAFDAVFSNAALHWMREPARVLANVRAALRPGGRFVAEQGGFANVAAVRTALVAALEAAGHVPPGDPWDFPTAAAQHRRLEAAGFQVVSIALIPRPTPLPTGIAGWLATFADPYLGRLPPGDRAAVLHDVERRLAPVLRDETGRWFADYVRLRFAAVAGS